MNIDIKAGTTRITQRGVLFPDGQIVWGDPADNNAVVISKFQDPDNPSGTYYLTENPRQGKARSFAKLGERFDMELKQLGIEHDSYTLALVSREIIVIVGEPTTINAVIE